MNADLRHVHFRPRWKWGVQMYWWLDATDRPTNQPTYHLHHHHHHHRCFVVQWRYPCYWQRWLIAAIKRTNVPSVILGSPLCRIHCLYCWIQTTPSVPWLLHKIRYDKRMYICLLAGNMWAPLSERPAVVCLFISNITILICTILSKSCCACFGGANVEKSQPYLPTSDGVVVVVVP